MDPVELAKQLFFRSVEHLEKEEWLQAEACLKEALQYVPDRPSLLNNLSVALLRLGKYSEAERVIAQVLSLEPAAPEGWANSGELCNLRGQHEAALEKFDTALTLAPDYVQAQVNRGIALNDLKRNDVALQCFDQVILRHPDHAEAWMNRGNALTALRKHQAASECYDRAIQLKPKTAANFVNRARASIALGLYPAAVVDADRAIALKPGYAAAYLCRGNAQLALGQFSTALESFDKAVEFKPDDVAGWFNQGHALEQMKRFHDALASYSRVAQLDPHYEFLPGILLHAKVQICDWRDFPNDIDHIKRAIADSAKASNTFPVLAFLDSPEIHRKAADIWVQHKCPADASLGPIAKRQRKQKIRIGYYSPDFRNHAVGFLAAGLYEAHDRDKFELFAFALGPQSNDVTRQRIAAAFDKFIDIRDLSDQQVAQMSRELEIDIAVDLGGYTEHCRTGIFALRAAPIQVNYLGYPSTMGAPYIDYLLADSVVIAPEHRQHYAEKIAYLPHSYQANDDKREEPEESFARSELGLPETGFVFCCFNNNFKIMPNTFDSWMRILQAVEGSVLWLLADNPDAVENLRKEAMLRGVSGSRLVFAERMTRSQHLARHRAADLFIDTLPYNAHTTASDALWLGLPLLTCMGKAFPARVAASLLQAMGLPDLITTTPAEFEQRAITLATSPTALRDIKTRLLQNRSAAPLFDTTRFARHVEAAYTAMMARYRENLVPADIHVPA